MIFAPLIGVNHHGQSIVFACAFLSVETTDSFLCAPKMIITDQDPAMTKAIHITDFLHENGWFQSLYEIRSKWVLVFVNHIFSAAMFNRALAHQRHEELIADHTNSNGKPVLKSQWSMENQMAELYT
ncbi:hypothetical protein ACOSQ2_019547 [Xanthoceras sorbifolium]